MKIKFLSTLVIAMLCATVFLVTTFIPSVRGLRGTDFLRGFAAGIGAVALIASVYYSIELQKEKKLSNEQ